MYLIAFPDILRYLEKEIFNITAWAYGFKHTEAGILKIHLGGG